LIFPLYFQLSNLDGKTSFQQAGSSAVKGTSQVVLGSSDHRKVPAILSLFLKSEKSQLCFTQEKDLITGPSIIFDLFPRPIELGHRSQIMEGPILRPFSYTKPLIGHSNGNGFAFLSVVFHNEGMGRSSCRKSSH
jgi:hypothetical protein